MNWKPAEKQEPESMEIVNWTRMEDGTKEEFEFLMVQEENFNADLVNRIFDQLKMMDVSWDGYKINRYQHSLQTATRAHRDGADEEMVVAALLHDIGDNISPYNHCELAAAMLRPYVSEKIYWIVK
jgi:predicted HD phosphohydrolase